MQSTLASQYSKSCKASYSLQSSEMTQAGSSSDLNNNQLFSEGKGGVKFLNHLILPISSATMALKNYGYLSIGSGSKSGLS